MSSNAFNNASTVVTQCGFKALRELSSRFHTRRTKKVLSQLKNLISTFEKLWKNQNARPSLRCLFVTRASKPLNPHLTGTVNRKDNDLNDFTNIIPRIRTVSLISSATLNAMVHASAIFFLDCIERLTKSAAREQLGQGFSAADCRTSIHGRSNREEVVRKFDRTFSPQVR